MIIPVTHLLLLLSIYYYWLIIVDAGITNSSVVEGVCYPFTYPDDVRTYVLYVCAYVLQVVAPKSRFVHITNNEIENG